jgi:hypothetical protein
MGRRKRAAATAGLAAIARSSAPGSVKGVVDELV